MLRRFLDVLSGLWVLLGCLVVTQWGEVAAAPTCDNKCREVNIVCGDFGAVFGFIVDVPICQYCQSGGGCRSGVASGNCVSIPNLPQKANLVDCQIVCSGWVGSTLYEGTTNDTPTLVPSRDAPTQCR